VTRGKLVVFSGFLHQNFLLQNFKMLENQISYDLDQVEINLQDQSSSRKMEEFLIVTAHLHQAQ
jgi:hypothetical protein